MRPLSEEISAELATNGFYLLDDCVNDAAFGDLARALGEVVDDTLVRLVPGRRTYLTNAAAIPLHTDHPVADVIAWRCEAQDEVDGASLLVDGRAVIGDLDVATRAELEHTVLPAMVRLGDEPRLTPVLDNSQEQFFFAPWLEAIGAEPCCLAAVRRLRDAIDHRAETPVKLRLQQGQVLLVDNHRMMHGRRELSTKSARRLRRLWIRRADRPTSIERRRRTTP